MEITSVESTKRASSEWRATVLTLWFRMMSLGVVGLVFAEALLLARGRVQSWTFYLTGREVIFEIVVRIVAAGLFGLVLGSVVTLALLSFLRPSKASHQHLSTIATKVAVVVIVFFDLRVALESLIKWSYNWWDHRGIFDTALLIAYVFAFIAALFFAPTRRELVTSLDPWLQWKRARRVTGATVIAAILLVATEFTLSRHVAVIHAAAQVTAANRAAPNVILITFDAMSAEDMSLYGYGLPTTPSIEAFARKATVFTNFYASSSFTTPCVASIITGLYPSDTGVHQLQATARGNIAERNLPYLMRSGGYHTAAFISNPYPYYFAKTLDNPFHLLPEPQFRQGGLYWLWTLTKPLHQDTGIGNRIDEYTDLENIWNFPLDLPNNQSLRFRPAASFDEARLLLDELPDRSFLWVHLMAPHDPYLPDRADQNRFVPESELQTFEKGNGRRWQPVYAPDQQKFIDRRRLGYDEYVASADRAFGAFIADLESRGKLRNTVVVVSADHGESFEGGIYQHESPYLTRPVIHVPLIVRMPDQEEMHTASVFADETSLAPTILDLAGQNKPEWMRSPSLANFLNGDDASKGEGQAFTEYLEKNSDFKPLRHGTVGIIDGQSHYEYVLDLETGKGWLRPLKQAQTWNLDRTKEEPELAETLRSSIYSRFPELPRK